MGAFAARSERTDETALKPDGAGSQLQAGDAMPEGTAVRGDENDVEEGDEGQYVNLAVDFSYDGRKNRKGYDLHFLIYMGMGVKGLGSVEVPIWVTMLKITGTVSLLRWIRACRFKKSIPPKRCHFRFISGYCSAPMHPSCGTQPYQCPIFQNSISPPSQLKSMRQM